MPVPRPTTVAVVIALLALGGCSGDEPTLTGPGGPDSTLAPVLSITSPPYVRGVPGYLEVTRFSWAWSGGDRPVDVRYFATMLVDTTGTYNPVFDMLGDLNENPQRYDSLWSEWKSYDAADGSGRTVVIGGNGELTYGRRHWFFVQGRGEDGNITSSFSRETNARLFAVTRSSGPGLYISERFLADFAFVGTNFNPEERTLPPGIPLSFYWRGDAEQYSGEIVGYRYGWDVTSLEQWDATFRPEVTRSAPAAFFAGVHTITIEALDLAGNITRGAVTIETVPWEMDRNLPLVDDYRGAPYSVTNFTIPPESDHDAFWESLCSRADGFDAGRDTWDTYSWGRAPSIETIGRYRNMIWVSSTDSGNKWKSVIEFTPESALGGRKNETPNLVSIFLQKGGHVWTLGRSDRAGGLSAALGKNTTAFPVDLRCEIGGPGACDTSGMSSLPYGDYCVTVIDKVSGPFRDDSSMPPRILDHHDVLVAAVRDDGDPLTAAADGLPGTLALRGDVTAEGSFFCTDSTCSPGGFTYVEVYDPAYRLADVLAASQSCFHPIYRMRAASGLSAVDGQPVAFWFTRYEGIVPDAPGGVAAPSVHFGFPLWYFRHESADSIADVIFGRWGL